jgi:HEAT repeat protein
MSLSKTQQDELTKIVSNLKDTDSDVRRWAIYDLEQLPPDATIEYLIQGIEDEHRAVREAAAEVLASVPPDICLRPLTPLLGNARIEVRNIAAAIIGKFGDAVVEYLLEALEHENEDVRKFSADILGLARSELAVDGLAKALYDSVENVGVSAAEALGKIQSPKALPYLIKGFQESDYLKRECAEALGLLQIPDGARFLTEHFFDTDDLLVQYAMVDAMGNAGDLPVLEFLEQRMPEITQPLQLPAAIALLKIARRIQMNVLGRDTTPLDLIVEAAGEGEEEYEQLLVEQLDESIEPEIISRLAQFKDAYSSHGLVALLKVAAPHAELQSFVIEMADHQDDWVSYTAIEHLVQVDRAAATKVLKQVLEGQRNLPQLAAIKTAAQLDIPKAGEWIRPFLDSEDEDLRTMAEQVLGKA